MSFRGRTIRRVITVANAFVPIARNPVLTIPSFFSAWLTTETAGPIAVGDLADAAVFAAKGGHRTPAGAAALTARLATTAALAYLVHDTKSVDVEFARALTGWRDPDKLARRPRSDRRGMILPFFNGGSRRNRIRDIPYTDAPVGRAGRLDAYVPEDRPPGERRPVVVYIHGGGWILGDKREQGIPLLNHLADNGFVCFSVNYRLSPKVKAPTHLIDVKRALAWIRANAGEYGGDGEFIAVIGNSAGGHLCALVALTANDPEFQPGFGEADTRVQAAVPFYGVYDMLDRDGANGGKQFVGFLERVVFGQSARERPDLFRSYSPLDQVHADAPPMLIVHGTNDVLVPIEGARIFVERLRSVSRSAVLFAELVGAQHAFDVYASPRTMRTVEWVEQFVTEAWERFRSDRQMSVRSEVVAR